MSNHEKVDAMLGKLDHPFKAEVEAIREIVKGLNPAIKEEWKWRAPSYSYRGEYLLTFNLWEQKCVHLVFHNPAIHRVESSLLGSLLEGQHQDRRMAYLADMDDVQARREELERVIHQLIEFIEVPQRSKDAEALNDLPKIGAPATRALNLAGIERLDQLTQITEAQLAQLHGVGPKAIRILRDALNARGWSFAEP
jgi:predicted flap endonuclease-1-like 5' DNA nuclease